MGFKSKSTYCTMLQQLIISLICITVSLRRKVPWCDFNRFSYFFSILHKISGKFRKIVRQVEIHTFPVKILKSWSFFVIVLVLQCINSRFMLEK